MPAPWLADVVPDLERWHVAVTDDDGHVAASVRLARRLDQGRAGERDLLGHFLVRRRRLPGHLERPRVRPRDRVKKVDMGAGRAGDSEGIDERLCGSGGEVGGDDDGGRLGRHVREQDGDSETVASAKQQTTGRGLSSRREEPHAWAALWGGALQGGWGSGGRAERRHPARPRASIP